MFTRTKQKWWPLTIQLDIEGIYKEISAAAAVTRMKELNLQILHNHQIPLQSSDVVVNMHVHPNSYSEQFIP